MSAYEWDRKKKWPRSQRKRALAAECVHCEKHNVSREKAARDAVQIQSSASNSTARCDEDTDDRD